MQPLNIKKIQQNRFAVQIATTGATSKIDMAWHRKANPIAHKTKKDLENKDFDTIKMKHEMKLKEYANLQLLHKIPDPKNKAKAQD